LIKTRMPMATSSHGENRKWRVKLRTATATIAMRTRAMINGIVIGLRSPQCLCSCLNTAAANDAGRSGLALAQPWSGGRKLSGSTLIEVQAQPGS